MRKIIERFIYNWVNKHNMYIVVYDNEQLNPPVPRIDSIHLTEKDASERVDYIKSITGERTNIYTTHFGSSLKY